jgi:hypothetical protein
MHGLVCPANASAGTSSAKAAIERGRLNRIGNLQKELETPYSGLRLIGCDGRRAILPGEELAKS